MALSAEQIYDELNGAEVKKILLRRFEEMLDTVPDFHPHLTLPRVHMHTKVHLDIYGRRNPSLDLESDLTLTERHPIADITLAKEMEAEDQLSADTGIAVPGTPFDGEGLPPDQIREEHELTVLEPVTDRAGITQQRPMVMAPPVETAAPRPTLPGGRRYAAFHTLERGGPVVQGFVSYLPGSEPILNPSSQDRDKPDIGIQRDFREAHKP